MKTLVLLPAILMSLCGVVHAEDVSNPVYEAWAKQKPGASVTTKIAITVEGKGEVRQMEQKETLKEVTKEAVVIEVAMTRKAGAGEQAKPEEVTIPATIEKSKAGLPVRSLDELTVTAMKEGKADVVCMGKSIATTTREFWVQIKRGDKSATGTIKTWYSTEVPGGMVKVESSFGTPAQVATMIVTETTAGK